MKRSEINHAIETAKKVFATLGIHLPPFAFWTVDDWKQKGSEATDLRKAMLGWDVTDFGRGQFAEFGRVLFTLRNGYRKDIGFSKDYAEKIILDPPNQRAPLHFHRSKSEDIINRGKGNILVNLYMSTPEGACSEDAFIVQVDGIAQDLAVGDIVRLEPGQSIYIPDGLIHSFWGEEGTGVEVEGIGYGVSGEVSSVNDDWNDNVFLEQSERFSEIEEDEQPIHLLCNEYPEP